MGSLTLLALKPKDDDLIHLSIVLGIIFTIGIALIVISTKAEVSRLKRDQNVIFNDFIKLKEGKICECEFLERLPQEHNSLWISLITEYLSIIFFIGGIAYGAYYINKNSDDLCENGEKCPKIISSEPRRGGTATH